MEMEPKLTAETNLPTPYNRSQDPATHQSASKFPQLLSDQFRSDWDSRTAMANNSRGLCVLG